MIQTAVPSTFTITYANTDVLRGHVVEVRRHLLHRDVVRVDVPLFVEHHVQPNGTVHWSIVCSFATTWLKYGIALKLFFQNTKAPTSASSSNSSTPSWGTETKSPNLVGLSGGVATSRWPPTAGHQLAEQQLVRLLERGLVGSSSARQTGLGTLLPYQTGYRTRRDSRSLRRPPKIPPTTGPTRAPPIFAVRISTPTTAGLPRTGSTEQSAPPNSSFGTVTTSGTAPDGNDGVAGAATSELAGLGERQACARHRARSPTSL